jgi:hypothetical protein
LFGAAGVLYLLSIQYSSDLRRELMRFDKKIFCVVCVFIVPFSSVAHSGEYQSIESARRLYSEKENCDLAWRTLWHFASLGSEEAFWELNNGVLNGLKPPNYIEIGEKKNGEYFCYNFLHGFKFGSKVKNRVIALNVKYRARSYLKDLSKGKSESICSSFKEKNNEIDLCIKALVSEGIILSRDRYIKELNKLFDPQAKAVCISTIPGL